MKYIKSKLQTNGFIVGEIDELNEKIVTLKTKDENFVQLAIDHNLHVALYDVGYGDIVKIKNNGEDYELTIFDSWEEYEEKNSK